MIKVNVGDAASGQKGVVLPDGELLVSPSSSPPLISQKTKIFSQYLTDDGLSDGSNDLGVDGSTTAVEYWIPAGQKNDIYINKLTILIGYGASAYLWDFADKGAALTNGVQLKYEDGKGDDVEIFNCKTNSDFIREALSSGIVGTAWELRHLGATNDYGILLSINLGDIVKPFGVQLDRGTQQKLVLTIRDNCTDADNFNCKASGFERFA